MSTRSDVRHPGDAERPESGEFSGGVAPPREADLSRESAPRRPTPEERRFDPSQLRDSYDAVIVGGGFAGAATAWAAARRGLTRLLLVDMEPVCGSHASGRNAGMVRTAVEDELLAALAREGRDTIDRLARETEGCADGVRYDRCGSFLLGAKGKIPDEVIEAGDHEFLAPSAAIDRVPLLAGGLDEPVLSSPGDGILEVHSLLQHYLGEARSRGVTVATRTTAVRVETDRSLRGNPRVEAVWLGTRRIATPRVVAAAGAWGQSWAAASGLDVALEPRRRHIVCTETPRGLDRRGWPWVWDLEDGFYFRPESAGLLWSPCDELAEHPGAGSADPDAALWLAEKVVERFSIGDLRPTRRWAGQRTFTPDGRFLLGPDPRLEGWHWAVGLGGHGVTVSSAVGERVASGLVGESEVEPELAWRPAVEGTAVRS